MKESKEKSLKRPAARRRRNFFMRARHKGNEECSRRVTFWSCWWERAQAIMWRNAFESKSRARALTKSSLSPLVRRRHRKHTLHRESRKYERSRRARQWNRKYEWDTHERYIFTAPLLHNIGEMTRLLCRHTMHRWRLMHCVRLWLTDSLRESASWVHWIWMHILRHCVSIGILMLVWVNSRVEFFRWFRRISDFWCFALPQLITGINNPNSWSRSIFYVFPTIVNKTQIIFINFACENQIT